jgi:signal transduction histidine kinase
MFLSSAGPPPGRPAAPARAAPEMPRLARSGRLVRHWHYLLLALGCAFVLLLLGSSHWQAAASLHALGGLQQQAARVEQLDSLLIQLMDAENAVRGYLLSGNRAHLEPYGRSLITVHDTLADIRRDLETNPANDEALADLSGLVAIKLKSLDLAVERGIAGEETRIQGKRYTDRIRERIFALKAQLAAEGVDSFKRSTHSVDRTRLVVATLTAGALALIVALFFVIERQLQLREQLAGLLQSENQRLDAVVQERTAELSDLASYLTNAREVEKARLARELHDELGALLTAAKMETGWLSRYIDHALRRRAAAENAEDLRTGTTASISVPATNPVPEAGGIATPDLCRKRLARLEEFLDGGIALKRRIIDDLRPPLLEDLGLVSTLRALGEQFSRGAGEVLRLELPVEDVELAPQPALALFRIAQEALTNIRKHAQARNVTLALRRVAGGQVGKGGGGGERVDSLELEIADDGVGFRSDLPRGRQHGLAGMRHRVQMCAGSFVLATQPGGGTRIVVRIPYAAAPAAQASAACRT